MEEQNLKVRVELAESSLKEEMTRLVKASGGFTVLEAQAREKPDLIVAQINSDLEASKHRIQACLSSPSVSEVFLIAPDTNSQILLWAMRNGIQEVFTPAFKAGELQQALERFKGRAKKNAVGKINAYGQIISIAGGKGGVGATTVAVNLAVALGRAHKNASVALLDMNTLFGEIPLFLEIKPQFHWGDLTKDINRLDETFLMNILSQHSSGVHVLSSPGHLNGHRRPTPEIMHQLLELMKRIFDYVVIDFGQTANDTALKTFALSTHLLLVATASLPCLANANKLLHSLVDLGFVENERTKIILNRYTKSGDISVKDARVGLGREIFWMIPNDYTTTMAAINQGKPLAMVAPKSKVARNFNELAVTLMPVEEKPVKKSWRLFGS
ncbi:MAG: P-loop NTPase [Desulfobacteraceae bacterium]|nr:P-loop NTPase [Desulfobacteraceae bacterium]